MRDPLTVPAEAYAPDADRAGPDAPAQLPEWLVRCLALLILFLLEPCNAVRLLRSGRLHVMVAGPAGPAGGLGAGRGRVDPRPIRSRDRLDVPPPRHRAGASGLAGAVPRHRGVRRQPEGIPRRRPGLRAAMVGKPQRRAGHDPWLRRARRGDRIAATAPGCCECCAAGAERHAGRSRACRSLRASPVACVMVVRISAARSLPVPAPVRRPGRHAARDCQLYHV